MGPQVTNDRPLGDRQIKVRAYQYTVGVFDGLKRTDAEWDRTALAYFDGYSAASSDLQALREAPALIVELTARVGGLVARLPDADADDRAYVNDLIERARPYAALLSQERGEG